MTTPGEEPHVDDVLPILDVRGLAIEDLLREDSALANAVRQVVDGLNQQDGSYAAHGSSP